MMTTQICLNHPDIHLSQTQNAALQTTIKRFKVFRHNPSRREINKKSRITFMYHPQSACKPSMPDSNQNARNYIWRETKKIGLSSLQKLIPFHPLICPFQASHTCLSRYEGPLALGVETHRFPAGAQGPSVWRKINLLTNGPSSTKWKNQFKCHTLLLKPKLFDQRMPQKWRF